MRSPILLYRCVPPFFFHSSRLIPLSKLHFALNGATHWTSHYNGFNYEEFYEFVIDFFEEDQSPEGKAFTSEILNWWNQYVPNSISVLAIADPFLGVYFHDRPPPEQPPLSHQDDCLSRRSDNDNAEHNYPNKFPSFGLY